MTDTRKLLDQVEKLYALPDAQSEVQKLMGEFPESQQYRLLLFSGKISALMEKEKKDIESSFREIELEYRQMLQDFSTASISKEALNFVHIKLLDVISPLYWKLNKEVNLFVNKIRLFEKALTLKNESLKKAMILPTLEFFRSLANRGSIEDTLNASSLNYKMLFTFYIKNIHQKNPALFTSMSSPWLAKYIPTQTYASKLKLFGCVAGGVTGFVVATPGVVATIACMSLWALAGDVVGEFVGRNVDQCRRKS